METFGCLAVSPRFLRKVKIILHSNIPTSQQEINSVIDHQGDHCPALPHPLSPAHPPAHLRADPASDVRQHSGHLRVKWTLSAKYGYLSVWHALAQKYKCLY